MTGIVLAGGRSTRFGRDKLLEPYRGVPLLHRAVTRVAAVCSELVVVTAPEIDPPLPDGIRARTVHDPAIGEGPLVGAIAGLAATRTPVALLAAGDMPDLQTRVLIDLLRALEDGSIDAVALADGDTVRPLPCGLRTAPALASARALADAGRRSVRELLEALDATALPEASWTTLDPGRRTLFDVDVIGDLDR